MRNAVYLLLAGALGVFAAAAPSNEKSSGEPAAPGKGDLKPFQGVWHVAGRIENGNEIPPVAFQDKEWAFLGNAYLTHKDGKPVSAGLIKIDPAQKPATIELIPKDAKAGKLAGIYLFDKDLLKVCLVPEGKARPTDFTSEPGSGRTLLVLVRPRSPNSPTPGKD